MIHVSDVQIIVGAPHPPWPQMPSAVVRDAFDHFVSILDIARLLGLLRFHFDAVGPVGLIACCSFARIAPSNPKPGGIHSLVGNHSCAIAAGCGTEKLLPQKGHNLT